MYASTALEGVSTAMAVSQRARVIPADECDASLHKAIDGLDRQSPFAHPFQTEAFAALSNTDPARPHYVVLVEDAKGLAAYWWGYFVRYRAAPWPRSAAWARSGPVLRQDLATARSVLLPELVATLKAHVRKQRVGWILVTAEALYSEGLEDACVGAGFKRRDVATYVIDLSLPTDELWRRLDPRLRRSVNKAKKLGVVVEEAISDDDIRSYYRLDVERAAVPGELPAPEDAYVRGVRGLLESGQGCLLLAREGQQVVGGSFIPYHGGFAVLHQHAVYPEGRTLRAGDLLYWNSIVAMKEKGCSRFDLVTVEVAPGPGSREEGVRKFKAKWRGTLVETPTYRYWSPALRLWRTVVGRFRG